MSGIIKTGISYGTEMVSINALGDNRADID